MTDPTAIIDLKVCPNCGAKAPLGWTIEHQTGCSGNYVCSLEVRPWPMQPGDKVVEVEFPEPE